MKIIINRGEQFGTADGVIKTTSELNLTIIKALKSGKARKLIDTEDTLMYEITE
jgi:hypothetical protein